jgi:5-methylthioribose kinase
MVTGVAMMPELEAWNRLRIIVEQVFRYPRLVGDSWHLRVLRTVPHCSQVA